MTPTQHRPSHVLLHAVQGWGKTSIAAMAANPVDLVGVELNLFEKQLVYFVNFYPLGRFWEIWVILPSLSLVMALLSLGATESI